MMNGRNTPGVGRVLERYGLDGLPEAHCFLRSDEIRIDVTRTLETQPSEKITHFIYEEEITPDQIRDYKSRAPSTVPEAVDERNHNPNRRRVWLG